MRGTAILGRNERAGVVRLLVGPRVQGWLTASRLAQRDHLPPVGGRSPVIQPNLPLGFLDLPPKIPPICAVF